MPSKLHPVVGVTTFSVLTTRNKGAYISSREKSWEEHVASILDPKRLAFRCKILTEITLPQFAAQTLPPDPAWFSYVVVTSKLLPPEFKAPLYEAATKYPWLKIVERDVDDYLGAVALIKQALSGMDYQGSVPFLSFRLDDDDALPLTYLERVQAYIVPDNVDKFLTFSNGAKILWSRTGFAVRNYQDEHRPFIAVGLAAISLFDHDAKNFASKVQSVFVGLSHYEIKNSNAFVDDETPHMFIWSHHASQDTAGRFKSVEFKGEWEAPPPEIGAKLAGYPYLARFIG